MRFTKRRTEYLLRRWVGKQAVAAALGMPGDRAALARIEIANRASGAPYVVVDGRPSQLSLSLTDRAGWGICLVGPDSTRVGCDLEIVEARSPGFVSDFLTEEEQGFVASQAARARARSPAVKTVSAPVTRSGATAPASTARRTASAEPSASGWRTLRIRSPNAVPSPARRSTCSARWPATSQIVPGEAPASSRRSVASTGRPSIGSTGFGHRSVSGRRRRPSPAAMTTASTD